MPGKAKIPQPIDRPLSRAYLRQFRGWSTAYPPGLSDPASLRVMENVIVGRDTGVSVRPGLRYISFMPDGSPITDFTLVGSHEVFFLNDGTKAYLFAVLDDVTVKFMVASYTGDPLEPFHVVDASTVFTDAADANYTVTLPTYIKYLQIDNKIIVLNDVGEPLRIFYVDSTKKVVVPDYIQYPFWNPNNKLEVRHPTAAWVSGSQDTFGPAATPTGNFLIDSDTTKNVYNIGLFWTYFNELGESAPSQVQVVKVSRPWSGWSQFGTGPEPNQYYDQLIARISGSPGYFEFDAAVTNHGARGAYMYMATWRDGEAIPVEALLVDTINFTDGSSYGTPPYDATEAGAWWNHEAWFQLTASVGLNARTVPMPSLATRRNYTDPSRGGNGIVAADRMVLVNDPTQPAVIKWTSNLQGEYINFSASRGGGIKTLTSGNLYIPAAVVLWQNPQSVDTLTIMCRGVDGRSTGYYMSPAEITSQSESTSVMGFEETSSSPGTTSPYGCEVFSTALYHPLEEQLQKSTAANYAIRHKSLTELISNQWQAIIEKEWIISSEFDGRLYYIVNNPNGDTVELGCKGNEIWVLDAQSDNPSWNRWLIPAVSLRKVEIAGTVYMSVVRPEGIFVLDPAYHVDDYLGDTDPPGGIHPLMQRAIPWMLETNTQGANRAHDAWCHLQQAQITLGNFQGKMKWGMRGIDINGKMQRIEKVTQDHDAPGDGPFDRDDYLMVQRQMKEWFFYAGSVTEDGEVQDSSGQIDLVQYRYTPISVNVGYEYGSVETFEYGRAVAGSPGEAPNGVPLPYLDTSRP